MITIYKNILIYLTIIIFVAMAAWITLPDNRKPFATAKVANLIPDAWMEEVTAVIMDKQGKPKIKIVSAKITHYAEQDISYLAFPKLTLYRPSLTPWYVSAQHAKAIHGIEQIDFWQNVVIHHAGDIRQPASLIKTNTLTVHPKQQTAETADKITMVQPNLTVKAIGMHASMITGNIKLLSNTRGEYAPNS